MSWTGSRVPLQIITTASNTIRSLFKLPSTERWWFLNLNWELKLLSLVQGVSIWKIFVLGSTEPEFEIKGAKQIEPCNINIAHISRCATQEHYLLYCPSRQHMLHPYIVVAEFYLFVSHWRYIIPLGQPAAVMTMYKLQDVAQGRS